jgi:hypothetical protein
LKGSTALVVEEFWKQELIENRATYNVGNLTWKIENDIHIDFSCDMFVHFFGVNSANTDTSPNTDDFFPPNTDDFCPPNTETSHDFIRLDIFT